MRMAEEREIRLHFTEDPNCPTVYANGAWGGVSPKGEIIINFFVDMTALPEVEGFKVDEHGTVKAGTAFKGFPEGVEENSDFERRVMARIIMTPGSAQSVADWLKNKVNELLAQRDQGKR